jgi:hypothetical protein
MLFLETSKQKSILTILVKMAKVEPLSLRDKQMQRDEEAL